MSIPHILIVEDEPLLLAILVEEFEAAGFFVASASSGEEAMEFIKNDTLRIDAMMTDVRMSGMDGWKLAKLSMMRRPALKIFYATGYCDSDALRVPQNRLFLKPYRIGDVVPKVREAISA